MFFSGWIPLKIGASYCYSTLNGSVPIRAVMYGIARNTLRHLKTSRVRIKYPFESLDLVHGDENLQKL